MEKQKNILIFCDGACSGNPGPGGWGSIILTPTYEVWELGGSASSTTNNQMELTAAIEALRSVRPLPGKIELYTDSTYVIRGITQWVHGWKKRDWKTAEGKDVLNRSFWEELQQEVKSRGKENKVEWKYVRGHEGNPGNERADTIAVAFSKRKTITLYHGDAEHYAIDLSILPQNAHLPEFKSPSAKAKPHSYLSWVDGTLMRHNSWAECEQRVKGRSGAKFKKATSSEEEEKILQAWGVSF